PKTPYPVIDLMPDQHNVVLKGGTMRLGRYPCHLKPQTIASRVYNQPEISERHRHRYEVNNKHREELARHGMVFSGLSPDENLVEMVELADHPYFVACQFHPELKSRPENPHPLFVGFVEAILARQPKDGSDHSSSPTVSNPPSAVHNTQ
ncbi:MAG: CTP synthetase, partial [Cyanobacteria bacterium]|nr:CTP synthetase [Cyanobacteriota bacterium]